MPPSGADQQDTSSDLVTELNLWRRSHPEFLVGTNEAGMSLGGEVRGADAAVWRRSDLPAESTAGFRRVPPVLAVEIAGVDDTLDLLRDKARWYLDHGVEVVWLLVPRPRSMRVITRAGEHELPMGGVVPPHPALPGLSPRVADLFRQLEDRESR
jgi:Uma2 family endonuclease